MARYDSLRKLERNRLLVEYREKHPEASWSEIGELFKISPQRAWEIYNNKRNRKATGEPVAFLRGVLRRGTSSHLFYFSTPQATNTNLS